MTVAGRGPRRPGSAPTGGQAFGAGIWKGAPAGVCWPLSRPGPAGVGSGPDDPDQGAAPATGGTGYGYGPGGGQPWLAGTGPGGDDGVGVTGRGRGGAFGRARASMPAARWAASPRLVGALTAGGSGASTRGRASVEPHRVQEAAAD
ncbi:MAG: hypothetical protein M0Z30_09655 [Actinomycetota bacterium]|nr:hypothetical protein [Actinomycetota bacterium]